MTQNVKQRCLMAAKLLDEAATILDENETPGVYRLAITRPDGTFAADACSALADELRDTAANVNIEE